MQKKLIYYIYFPLLTITIMWLSKTVEYSLHLDFKSFGIFPRTLEGLRGIVFSPFIHNDFNHLISNTIPLFLLSTSIFYFYRKSAIKIIIVLWIITSFTVWLGGRYAWHIGASGLVYAFASFMFFSGITSKQRELIAISLLVSFLYGSMIWGIFPGNENISWESHLFGFVSGFIMAFYIGKSQRITEEKVPEEIDDNFAEISSTHDSEYDLNYYFKEEN